MFSNAESLPRDPTKFWDLLRSTGGQDPVRLFAVVNNALIVRGPMNVDVHTELEAEFADAGLRNTLAAHRSKSEADIVLFNRPANLLALKLLLGVDRPAEEAADALTRVGTITLHANDHVASPEEMWEDGPDLIAVLAEFAPIWELTNPRDIFQLFVRTFLIVTEDLARHENMTKILTESFGAGPQDLHVDGLRMEEHLALVFGIYTNVRDAVLKQKTCIIDMEQFYNVTTLPHEGIRVFLDRRSGDADAFHAELNLGITGADTFTQFITNGGKAMDAIVIKQRPMFRHSDGHYSILDARFLIELASTTLYWTIFDQLDKKGRDLFSIFWGECFERFVLRELEFFYPVTAQLLHTHVAIADGEIDALLDYVDFVITIEVKSGLLAKDPRLMRDPDVLRAEIEKKFVTPKGVRQLAKAAQAVVAGEAHTLRSDCRVYPILVVDEPVLQCFAANRYLDERFKAGYPDRPVSVAPMTIMLIDELEELLPYVAAGAIGWREVLDARFTTEGVVPDPFHTTLVSVRRAKDIAHRRNEFLSAEGTRIGKLIKEKYVMEKMKPT